MREIKFRCWDKRRNWMIYGDDSCGFVDIEKHEVDVVNFILSEGFSKNLTFLQYTGLKDKNGREIYEGDIIEIEYIEDEVKTLHQVVWGGNEYPAWDVKPYWDGECNVFSDIYCSGYYKVKVIGNVYENPELLEGN